MAFQERTLLRNNKKKITASENVEVWRIFRLSIRVNAEMLLKFGLNLKVEQTGASLKVEINNGDNIKRYAERGENGVKHCEWQNGDLTWRKRPTSRQRWRPVTPLCIIRLTHARVLRGLTWYDECPCFPREYRFFGQLGSARRKFDNTRPSLDRHAQ